MMCTTPLDAVTSLMVTLALLIKTVLPSTLTVRFLPSTVLSRSPSFSSLKRTA